MVGKALFLALGLLLGGTANAVSKQEKDANVTDVVYTLFPTWLHVSGIFRQRRPLRRYPSDRAAVRVVVR